MSLHHKYSSEDLRRANEFLNSQAGVSFLRFIEECCAPSADHSSDHMSIVSAGRFEQHREIMDMMAVNMLVRTLYLIKTRPAQESAFIAAVNLENVEKHYGVVVSEIIGDGKWADRGNA